MHSRMDLADRNLNPAYLIQRQPLCRCSARQRLLRPQHAAPYPPSRPPPSRHPARLRQALAPHPQRGPRRAAAMPPQCRSWPRRRSRPRGPRRASYNRHPRPQQPSTAVPAVSRRQDSQRETVKGIAPSRSWQAAIGNRRERLTPANVHEFFCSLTIN